MFPIRELSPELAKKATEELQESEARINAGLRQLRKWYSLQPHLEVQLDDQYLIAFLRGCKFSLERAIEKIDNFYTERTFAPEIFKNRDPTAPPLKELIERGLFLPLENRTDPTGPIFLYVKSDYDPSKYSIHDYLKYNFLLMDILICDYDQINVSGIVTIVDCKDTTWKHMTSYTPSVAKKSLKIFTESYPVPSSQQHYINPPTGFDIIISLLKLFLPASISNKIHVHTNLESLYKHVPKENLPKEYGGNAGSFSELTEKWKSIIEKNKNFLIDGEKYCSNENLRRDGPIKADDSTCSVM